MNPTQNNPRGSGNGAGLDTKARDDICLTRRPSISEKPKDNPVLLNSSREEEEPHQ